MGDDQSVRAANDLVGHVQRLWLMVVGLAAEIDDLRFQPEGRVVPAPGLEALRIAADAAAADAHELADRVSILARDSDDEAVLAKAMHLLRGTLAAVQTAARRLAQLGMGVSAATLGGDRIERLDRACVAVLRSPELPQQAVRGDELLLTGRTRPELQVELAGLVCRLLIDRTPALQVSVPDRSASLAVETGDVLRLCWLGGSDAIQDRRWESPVMVSEPTNALLEFLFGDGGGAQDVVVSVGTESGKA